MVWGGDVIGAGHASGGNNVDLEIGCLIDLATGLVTFTANSKEISTSYQVLNSSKHDYFSSWTNIPVMPTILMLHATWGKHVLHIVNTTAI